MTTERDFTLACPIALRHDTVQLAHGGGGRLSREIVEAIFLPAFGASRKSNRHDSAVFDAPGGRIAMTTDGYVVKPLFFPGGDIGKLAVCGTINDLAMAGAIPKYLSASFVIEEGFSISDLVTIAHSMGTVARAANVEIITGDTKVVDRGKGDGVFITTTGVGAVPNGVVIEPQRARPGDIILVSGDLGKHGIAVLTAREGLALEGPIESDCAPVHELVRAMVEAGIELHCLRDPTRGGIASALNEIAMDGAVDIEIDERAIAVDDVVRGACELFGLDPLYVACEGRLVAMVAEHDATRALSILRSFELGANAARIGMVATMAPPNRPGRVTLRGRLGTTRLLDLFAGEQLPRIC